MVIRFAPAVRPDAPLVIGLMGQTGCGKTFTALTLATGIVGVTGGKIALINTEGARGLQYAPDASTGYNRFQFDHADMTAPFSPARYREYIRDGAAHVGPRGVVIVDSMSHEHEGEGGTLQAHDEETQRLAERRGGDRERQSYVAWRGPKEERMKLVFDLYAPSCHLILCFRAKEKMVMAKKVKNGREFTDIVPIGWQPITGDEIPFTANTMLRLDENNKGRPDIHEEGVAKVPDVLRHLIDTSRKMTVQDGAALARWAMAGAAPSGVTSGVVPFSSARQALEAITAAMTDKAIEITEARLKPILDKLSDNTRAKLHTELVKRKNELAAPPDDEESGEVEMEMREDPAA